MSWNHEFDVVFNPNVVAVVGASRRKRGDFDDDYLSRLLRAGFPGRIYPVNPKADSIRGYKSYPSVSSIPEAIDLVVISTPANAVPGILEDCITKGARNIFIYTAGFEETGEVRGEELGDQVKSIAQRGNLRIVGPNCMGVCVPKNKISTITEVPAEAGSVAFLSQSGGHASEFISYGREFGLGFSKVISFGNAYTLESTDFLEYLATDDDTKIICMYLEGLRDGSRFFRLARKINQQKPIIIWKGGLTTLGARTANSHTASLAGHNEIWEAFFKQTGIIKVSSLAEMADVAMTFNCLKPPKGRRAALVVGGGGISVAAADDCSRMGIELPVLTEKTISELKAFIRVAGMIFQNPLDLWEILRDQQALKKTLKIVTTDPLIDLIIIMQSFDTYRRLEEGIGLRVAQSLVEFAADRANRKPLAVVIRSRGSDSHIGKEVIEFRNKLLNSRIPVYRNLTRAAQALAKFMKYHHLPVNI